VPVIHKRLRLLSALTSKLDKRHYRVPDLILCLHHCISLAAAEPYQNGSRMPFELLRYWQIVGSDSRVPKHAV
jgi:hypothetical protein